MIDELTIQNYALIEKARVEFAAGFNVLSGETGAGKSILIGALGLLLGSKSDTEVIRTGSEEALVAGTFRVEPSVELDEWLATNAVSIEDGTLILRRVVRPQKRGGCYVASTPVTRSQLEELTSYLVDLHGQHEHQSLFNPDHHRNLLDRYCALDGQRKAFSSQFTILTQLRKDLDALVNDESSREEELSRLRLVVGEIERAQVKVGEDDELKAEKKKLDQFEKLFGALEAIGEHLSSGRSSALGQLRSAASNLQVVGSIDDTWTEAFRRLETATIEIEDIAESLHAYQLHLDFSPDRLEEINARLTVLHGLEKKYGPGLEGVLETLETAKTKLATFENFGSEKEKAEAAFATQEKLVIQAAMALSQKRQEGAQKLEAEILTALRDLGMPQARFQISFQRRIAESGKPICTAWGMDLVEFLFSANPGEGVRALKEIASGGELSRVMLAMKTILSDADNIPILIFDEIDTGIGGEMGQALGRYMKRLSQRKQVLCITHLASIASFADHHVKIEKKTEGERTHTLVSVVTGEERIREVARMLSGQSFSEASLEHARELVEQNATKR